MRSIQTPRGSTGSLLARVLDLADHMDLVDAEEQGRERDHGPEQEQDQTEAEEGDQRPAQPAPTVRFRSARAGRSRPWSQVSSRRGPRGGSSGHDSRYYLAAGDAVLSSEPSRDVLPWTPSSGHSSGCRGHLDPGVIRPAQATVEGRCCEMEGTCTTRTDVRLIRVDCRSAVVLECRHTHSTCRIRVGPPKRDIPVWIDGRELGADACIEIAQREALVSAASATGVG